MIGAAPIVAMFWENWRLSRVEAAQRLALGIVAASCALAMPAASVVGAFWTLVAVHGYFWFSIAKLNGGRFMDGYKPGFPLYLLYTQPVPTSVCVGVAMAYDAVSCAALYLVSAAIVGLAFDQALPMFSVALYLAAFHLVCTCIQWSTRSRAVQWVASIVIGWPAFFLLYSRAQSPLRVEFSTTEYAMLILVSVVSYGLTVAGVSRQRRGDAVASVPRAARSGGYPVWLVSLFRLPCPISSATRAQIWFELKSSGLPALTIGLGAALLIALLFALGVPFAPFRTPAVGISIFVVPFALFTLGNNAFGVRRKQGRMYASAFEATQPYGTAQMAGLKVLVRAVCVLVALLAIGMSFWASSSLLGAWGSWLPDGKHDGIQGFLKLRQMIAGSFGGQTSYAQVAKAIAVCLAVGGLVAWQSSREALKARYPRSMLAVTALLLVFGLTIIAVGVSVKKGMVSPAEAHEIIIAAMWISLVVVMIATIYILWSGFAERVLTVRYTGVALGVCAAFSVALLAVTSSTNLFAMSWLVLPLLMAAVAAPWSLSRVRHL